MNYSLLGLWLHPPVLSPSPSSTNDGIYYFVTFIIFSVLTDSSDSKLTTPITDLSKSLLQKLFKVPLYTGLLSGEIFVKMLLQIYNFLKSLIIVCMYMYMYLQFSYIGIFIGFIQLHVFSICFKLLIKMIDSHPCIKKCTMLGTYTVHSICY